MALGRPHALADPDYAKQVAELFVRGLSRKEMCAQLGVSNPDTITRWRRDPRVKNIALKLSEDRILQITRKIDSEMEARLEKADKMTVRELIEVRKEFLGGALRAQTEKADEETVQEAIEAIEKNPQLLEDIQELLDKAPAPTAADLPEE